MLISGSLKEGKEEMKRKQEIEDQKSLDLLSQSLKILKLSNADDLNESKIKRAYHRVAKLTHPDKTKESTEDVFDVVTKAYHYLNTYVASISKKPGSLFYDLSMIDKGLNQEKSKYKLQTQDILIHIYVQLEEIFKGTSRLVKYFKIKYCEHCNGIGLCLSETTSSCSECKGGGYIIRKIKSTAPAIRVPCKCITEENEIPICEHCHGSKCEKIESQVTMNIAPRSAFDYYIDFLGSGHILTKGGPPGVLRVVIKEQPHPLYQRSGFDLITIWKITPFEAWCGFKKRMVLFGEESITVSTLADPPVVQGGMKTIPELGFPIKTEGESPIYDSKIVKKTRGDLVIKWDISVRAKRSILATLLGFLYSMFYPIQELNKL